MGKTFNKICFWWNAGVIAIESKLLNLVKPNDFLFYNLAIKTTKRLEKTSNYGFAAGYITSEDLIKVKARTYVILKLINEGVDEKEDN